MEFIVLLFVIAFVFGLLVLLPLLIKHLNKRDKRLKLLLLLPLAYLVYSIYTAVYPPDSFYKIDFKEVTGVDFPSDAEIIFKTASYPDQFGDYGSVSIVKVDRKFYEELPAHLERKGLLEKSKSHGSVEFDEAMNRIKDKKIERQFSLEQVGGYYYVAFLSDNESLIVNRQSW
jgi:hypothetical protein